jgi:hypothetical protein
VVEGSLVPDEAGAVDDFAGRFQRIFQGLAEEIRDARRALHENERLRQENEQLREALAECVESCGRYLSPTLGERLSDPEQEDHERARVALERARRLLEGDGPPRLTGPG